MTRGLSDNIPSNKITGPAIKIATVARMTLFSMSLVTDTGLLSVALHCAAVCCHRWSTTHVWLGWASLRHGPPSVMKAHGVMRARSPSHCQPPMPHYPIVAACWTRATCVWALWHTKPTNEAVKQGRTSTPPGPQIVLLDWNKLRIWLVLIALDGHWTLAFEDQNSLISVE